MTQHRNLGLAEIHLPYNWEYADTTEREADSSVVAIDEGKFARQLDNNSIWMLTDYTGPTWVEITSSTPAGSVVQVVQTQTGAVATGTTTIPLDDSIPQNTEGTEFMTLAITPTDSGNDLYVEAELFFTVSVISWIIMALFMDTTANALHAVTQYIAVNTGGAKVRISYKMAAGTTSPITFKIRAGMNTAGTVTFNGQVAGRWFGGVMSSSIKITEVAA